MFKYQEPKGACLVVLPAGRQGNFDKVNFIQKKSKFRQGDLPLNF